MRKIIPLIFIVFLAGLSTVKEASHKRLHHLDIPAGNFVSVKLKANDGVRLPINKFPAVGQHVAFKLIKPSENQSIDIVIRTELVTDEFLDELQMHHAQASHSHKQAALQKMYQTAVNHKNSVNGLHMIYSRVHGLNYKLISVQVPGIDENGVVLDDAIIVATPHGNLQLFSASDEPGKKHVVELKTRHMN